MSCHCIKCGREIPQGQMLCQVCELPASAVVAPAASPPPKKQPKKTKKIRSPKKIPGRKIIRSLSLCLILAILLLAAAIAYIVMRENTLLARSNRLRVREASVTLREKEADNRDNRIQELAEQLETSQDTIKSLRLQLADLDYADEDGNAVLQEAITKLEEENRTLRSEKMTLELETQKAKKELEQYESSVVFAAQGEQYFHSYGCEDFPEKKVRTMSLVEAKAAGFLPCPLCREDS